MIGDDDLTAQVFICGPKVREKRVKCSVCGSRWSTRLCDGDVGGGRTCDAPLCMNCTVQSAPVEQISPDWTIRAVQRQQALKNRTLAQRDLREQRRPIPFRDADPRDFCPKHAPGDQSQGDLFAARSRSQGKE